MPHGVLCATVVAFLCFVVTATVTVHSSATEALTAAFPIERRAQADSTCVDYGNCTKPTTIAITPDANAVADYHVILWTGVLLALILLGSIATLLGMEQKDPALFVQLQDSSSAAGGAGGAGRGR